MLERKRLLETVVTKLVSLELAIKRLNDIRLFDMNIVAEDFFAELLNSVYDYSLVNLNHDDPHQTAIDLGDKGRRLAVQVTSERTKVKIQDTIDKFCTKGLAADYDSLKVLILNERTGNYPTIVLPENFSFSGKDDVIDMRQLVRDIQKMNTPKLAAIVELLDRELPEPKKDGGELIELKHKADFDSLIDVLSFLCRPQLAAFLNDVSRGRFKIDLLYLVETPHRMVSGPNFHLYDAMMTERLRAFFLHWQNVSDYTGSLFHDYKNDGVATLMPFADGESAMRHEDLLSEAREAEEALAQLNQCLRDHFPELDLNKTDENAAKAYLQMVAEAEEYVKKVLNDPA